MFALAGMLQSKGIGKTAKGFLPMQPLLALATTVLFTAHLLAVNLAMAGPLLCIWLEWRDAKRDDPLARRIDLALARWSLAAFGLGILIGVALLGLLWLSDNEPYFAAVRTLPADRLAFTGGELLFYLVCQGVYCRLARRRLEGRQPSRRGLSRVLAIAAASNLMYHFPALFSMLAVISNRPELWDRTLDRPLYRALLIEPEVVSRVLHVWLAAIATAGAAVMLLASRLADPSHGPSASPLAAAGARWALIASLAQLPVGLWVLFELRGPAAAPLWNGDIAVLLLVGGGILLAMLLLQQLAGLSLGDCTPKNVRRSAITTAAVVLLMCGAVDRMQRLAMLEMRNAERGTRNESLKNSAFRLPHSRRVGAKKSQPGARRSGLGSSAKIHCGYRTAQNQPPPGSLPSLIRSP
jgi:hypothetical protein